jgi:acyl carrier protein
MDTTQEIIRLLIETLSLRGAAADLKADTPLFGVLPELDSMAVVAVVTAIEERFGIVVADEDIGVDLFASVGSLAAYVERKLGA